ncbi:MAG: hypothetical protein AAF481_14390 [Acidobacteriota bacterium]
MSRPPLRITSVRTDKASGTAVINGEGGSVEAGIFVELDPNHGQGMAEALGDNWFKEFPNLEPREYTVRVNCQGEDDREIFDMRD